MPETAIVTKLALVPLAKIKPYHRNVRINDETVSRLVELIPKVGFNVPLVLDRNNTIVKGHARWKAAVKLGLAKIPCVYTDADDETIKLDRLADNRVQEFTQWDDEMLASELASLNLDVDVDSLLESLDFVVEQIEIDEAEPEPDEPDEAEPDADDENQPAPRAAAPQPEDIRKYTEITCSKCGYVMFIKGGEAATDER
jgi:ParB-like chromosome segregation protein Spo0J